MKTKFRIITEIKRKIKKTNPLCSGQCEIDHDVLYSNLGENVVALIEEYNEDTVGVSVYSFDNLVDEFEVYYEDLNIDQLYEINENIDNYLVMEEEDI